MSSLLTIAVFAAGSTALRVAGSPLLSIACSSLLPCWLVVTAAVTARRQAGQTDAFRVRNRR
jgi:hypothetical protein